MENLNSSDLSTLAYLRKETIDVYNRLHSIAEDISFVNQVHVIYPDMPISPNLRCGAWYSDPSITAETWAYFKSTDGHFSNWSFNLRRPNLHLLPIIIQRNGIILVDSTRSGKRIPDALSKTVPIWCAVINRAVAIIYPEKLHDTSWDTRLYTPPTSVSKQEHRQIETCLDAWARGLADSSFTLPALSLPLRPLWITPSTNTFPKLPTAASELFLPVICVSASKQTLDATERRSNGFSYIQGSGDDHELWGMGLTPQMFWKHQEKLLSASRENLPDLIISLVSATNQQLGSQVPPSPIEMVSGLLMICKLSEVAKSEFGEQTKSNLNHGTAFLLISDEFSEEQQETKEAHASESPSVLKISCSSGKKGQMVFLNHVLPTSLSFIGSHLNRGNKVCIACETGQDASVGVTLAALQNFFNANGERLKSNESNTPNKKSIRTRLEWIVGSRPQVNPSRATLKRVNEFFLSPALRPTPHRP